MPKAQAARGRAGKAAPGKTKKQAASKAGKTSKSSAKKGGATTRKSAEELRIEQFVSAYFACNLNGRMAAIKAGYSAERARVTASELLARPDVQEMVQARQAQVLQRLEATQDMVLERLTNLATADPRELTELHRGCCRYCWGKNNLFQRTPREMAEARANWQHKESVREAKQMPPGPPFDEAGGVGWNPKRDPNPACPECFGDGEARVVFKDTRDLSPSAKLLYAGIEQTQHGLKVRINSQTDALLNVGKHLGMFATKVKLGADPEAPPESFGFVVVPAKAEQSG